MTTASQRLQIELAVLRDGTIKAIRDGQLGQLKEGLDAYEALVEHFMRSLAELGASYGREQTLREVHSIGGTWSEVDWIENDYRELLDAALDTENWTVIDDVLYFPIRLATKAVRNGDYYIFYRFLQWLPYAYDRGTRFDNKKAGERLVDRCGRYLQDFLWLAVGPFLNVNESPEFPSPKQLEDYGVGVLRVFSDLLKRAMDLRRLDDYCLFASQLERGLGYIETSGDDIRSGAVSAAINLRRWRELLFLGSMAWLTRLLDGGVIDGEEWRKGRDCSALPVTPADVWSLYVEAHRRDTGDVFAWRNWELDENPEGEAMILSFTSTSLARVTVLLMLSAMNGDQLIIPPSEQAATSDSADSDFGLFLNDVENQRERWEPVLQIEDLGVRIHTISGALHAAATAEARQEAERVILSPLSPARLDDVAANIARAWREVTSARSLATEAAILQDAGEPPAGLAGFGLNSWEYKVLYLDDPGNWATSGWGEEYGRRLARGETDRFIQALRESTEMSPGPASPDAISTQVSRMEREGMRPWVINVASWSALLALRSDPRFTISETPRSHGKIGDFAGAPFYNLYSSEAEGVFVVDLASLLWRQYLPRVEPEAPRVESRIAEEHLFVRWQLFDAEEAQDLAANNSAWQRRGGEELSIEEAATEVQQRVFFSLREWFEIDRATSGIGLFFAESAPS